MSLRLRLAVTAALVIAPLWVALLYFDGSARQRAAERLLIELVSAQIASDRARCEEAPERWGGRFGSNGMPGPRPPPGMPAPPPGMRPRPRPPVVFAYATDLQASNPRAPAIPDALRAAIRDAEVATTSSFWPSEEFQVLVRTPWRAGPCAFVLASGSTGDWGALLPRTHVWAVPMLVVVVTFLLAMGPVVRRIRLLTHAVARSASDAYAHPLPTFGGDEIGQLGRAFEAAGREIRAQLEERARREQALRDFIANTTHDVMIPLTVLQGHLAALRECAARQVPPDAERVASAMGEAHYMASLIHNLAAAARLEMAEREPNRIKVDLNELIARVIARHAPIAQQRGISLENATPDSTLYAEADITLLEQAVSNVTYNAIAHNRRGGHAAVILEEVASSRFRVRVIDDGPGMSEAELERLVQRGARGNDARTRLPEGQGLGLHIAYRALQLHGFSLELQPGPGGGLSVTIEGTRLEA